MVGSRQRSGATPWQYWRMVVIPILWPSVFGTLLLLFANAFGAVATAVALTGSSLNIVPIVLFAQIRATCCTIRTSATQSPSAWWSSPAFPTSSTSGCVCAPKGGRNDGQKFLVLARRCCCRRLFHRAAGGDDGILHAHARRGTYSFDAYRSVFSDQRFAETFSYSVVMALITIVVGALLIVPTAYWVRLRMPYLRPVVEFVTLLPLVVPAIVIVFGYLRLYNSSSVLPLTNSDTGTNILLVFGFMTMSLPYMYRAVDTAMRTIDVAVLTEAAESLGASWTTILFRCIFPNVLTGVLSGAFITFAIAVGEFTMPSLLNRPAFGPYLALIGANKAYEPPALAMIAFAMTWVSIILINITTRLQKGAAGAR